MNESWTAAGRGKTFTVLHPSSEVLCAYWIVSSVYNAQATSADKHRNCCDQIERNNKDKKAAFLRTVLIGNLGTVWDIRSYTHIAISLLPPTSRSLISSSTIPVGRKVNTESFPSENTSLSESSPVSQDRDECQRAYLSGLRYLNREGIAGKRHYLDKSCSLAVSALCKMEKIYVKVSVLPSLGQQPVVPPIPLFQIYSNLSWWLLCRGVSLPRSHPSQSQKSQNQKI